ncbi:MAG: IcmE (DotG) [Gammaproteobacteria bacterium]|jgi:type IV secretory pathway VirB10-like protein|nr:IcmE (DotG) [Gammaproteobacteria bacterium]
MASRLDNISQLFSNFRTRSIIIVTLLVIGLAILIGIIRLARAPGQQVEASASLANAPTQKTVPGLNKTSPEYTQLQQQLNQQRIQTAEKTGGSAIPTLSYQDNTDTPTQLPVPDTGAPDPNINKTVVDPQIAALQAQVAAQNQQIQQATAVQVQQATTDKSAAMRTQAQQLLQAWGQSPTQSYQVGANEDQFAAAGTTPGGATSATQGNAAPVLIKAGDIQFAVLNTEINSDEPGPVMATVVLGPYKGAKLLGELSNTKNLPGSNGAEAVVVRFTIMSFAGLERSLPISAVAIDPNTARTALASDVDHHYLMRYGSLFASSFLQGYGNAALQAGSSVTQNEDGGTFTTYPDADPRREVASGFGTLGQNWGQQLGETFNRQNTITVNAGIGLGILFLTDVTANSGTPSTGIVQALATKNVQDQIAAENAGTTNVLPIEQAQNQLIQAVPNTQNGQSQ